LLPAIARRMALCLLLPVALTRAAAQDDQALQLMNEGMALIGGADAAEARRGVDLLEQAAHRGAPVMVLLGDVYRHGIGIPADPSKAARWYRVGAEMGDGLAQFELARLYLTGRGVAPDLVRAGLYLQLADAHVRDQGVRNQVRELMGHVRLRATARDWEQIRRLVTGWRPKELDDLLN